MAVIYFVSKELKVRSLAVVDWLSRCFLVCDMVLPADWRGLRLKMRAADLVGTAPLRLLRSTLCILPGTEGHDATPSKASG